MVLGWTPPAGSRVGIGSLHVGYHDPQGGAAIRRRRRHRLIRTRTGGCVRRSMRWPPVRLKDAGRRAIRSTADPLGAARTGGGDPVRLLVRCRAGAAGGLSRPARGQERRRTWCARSPIPRPSGRRYTAAGRVAMVAGGKRGFKGAVPPVRQRWQSSPAPDPPGANPYRGGARAQRGTVTVGGVELTHPDRELWPGITKRDLAEYWDAVAGHALPGIGAPAARGAALPGRHRRRAILPEARSRHMPSAMREGSGRQAVSRDRRRGRADRHGADVGDRAAPMGRDRGRSAASRTGWCSTSIPAKAWRSPQW